MKRAILSVFLPVFLGPIMLVGQDSKVNLNAEEAAIRAVIASGKILYTDDSIDWIGSYKRPVVGGERGEPSAGSDIAKRKNVTYTTRKIERLEIAASGDMAWEYSIGHTEYDLDEPARPHKSYDVGRFRVWKKVKGEWKVAARFARALDVPPLEH